MERQLFARALAIHTCPKVRRDTTKDMVPGKLRAAKKVAKKLYSRKGTAAARREPGRTTKGSRDALALDAVSHDHAIKPRRTHAVHG